MREEGQHDKAVTRRGQPRGKVQPPGITTREGEERITRGCKTPKIDSSRKRKSLEDSMPASVKKGGGRRGEWWVAQSEKKAPTGKLRDSQWTSEETKMELPKVGAKSR